MNPRRRMLGPWRRRPCRTTPATSWSLNSDEPDFGRGWALHITEQLLFYDCGYQLVGWISRHP
ncbi:hypothetical protein CSHISOI_08521 [Colletotrichum shisoi]|uniref:Uncharacterized protein n=1 Tax=Colletotrichum shisoi TaxID=2078593 RepID=A0A5Q4BIZ8_9PEZI|nr:hypothetical protein CSHISOI_08521 [Colletotrichum shisoi]